MLRLSVVIDYLRNYLRNSFQHSLNRIRFPYFPVQRIGVFFWQKYKRYGHVQTRCRSFNNSIIYITECIEVPSQSTDIWKRLTFLKFGTYILTLLISMAFKKVKGRNCRFYMLHHVDG